MPKPLLTPAEARVALRRTGRSVNDFARELGVHRNTVFEVLGGRKKGLHGDAHKVAVALGIKEGVILPDDVSTVEALRASQKGVHA